MHTEICLLRFHLHFCCMKHLHTPELWQQNLLFLGGASVASTPLEKACRGLKFGVSCPGALSSTLHCPAGRGCSCRQGFFSSSFYADRVLTNQLLWHLCTDWIRQSLRKLLMSNPFYQKDRLNSCLMMHFKCIFDVFQKQRHFSPFHLTEGILLAGQINLCEWQRFNSHNGIVIKIFGLNQVFVSLCRTLETPEHSLMLQSFTPALNRASPSSAAAGQMDRKWWAATWGQRGEVCKNSGGYLNSFGFSKGYRLGFIFFCSGCCCQ